MNHRALEIIRKISLHLPLAGTIVLLTISTFYGDLLDTVPLSLLLATMALAFILTAVHLESVSSTTTGALATLTNQVETLESTQRNYLTTAVPAIQLVSLARGFELASASGFRIDELRIFAISSQQILGFLRFYPFEIRSCKLLLRAFTEDDQDHKDFGKQIELVVRDWRSLAREGRIKHLAVRSYNFFPTEYECIFDQKILMLGLYDSDPNDYSEVRVRGAALIHDSTLPTKEMIQEYTRRFDLLFDTCQENHGSDRYNL